MQIEVGHVAVITGAGSGIGRALAVELAGRGCDLALCDVTEAVSETARTVEGMGRRVLCSQVDVADRGAMEGFALEVRETLGPAQILVNNAGVSLSGDMAEYSLDDWDWLLGINVYGVIHGIHFFLPQLVEKGGHIVNLSSLFGLIGVGGQSAYCASKFAVRGLSESIDQELRESGVGVTSVHPGAIATNIVRGPARYRGTSDTAAARGRAAKVIGQGMPPEEAARRIADAIERGQARLVLTNQARVMDLVARVFPTLYRRLVAQGRARMTAPSRR